MESFKPDSSNVLEVSYDGTKEEMTITFKGNRAYKYSQVSNNIFTQMKEAESVGKFVNDRIIGLYPTERVS